MSIHFIRIHPKTFEIESNMAELHPYQQKGSCTTYSGPILTDIFKKKLSTRIYFQLDYNVQRR